MLVDRELEGVLGSVAQGHAVRRLISALPCCQHNGGGLGWCQADYSLTSATWELGTSSKWVSWRAPSTGESGGTSHVSYVATGDAGESPKPKTVYNQK